MNQKTSIKRLDESIRKTEEEIKELESSFLISFSMTKASEISNLRRALKTLKSQKEHFQNIQSDGFSSEIMKMKELNQGFNHLMKQL